MTAARRIGLLLLVIAASGCGSGSTRRETVPVTGIVTYNGEPVEGAAVVFGAASGQQQAASAITDSAGRFTLTTYEKNDGAIPGRYTVAISKTRTIGGMTEDEEHAAIAAGQAVKPAEVIDDLPEKYKDGAKSGLTAEVAADRENQFEFALTD